MAINTAKDDKNEEAVWLRINSVEFPKIKEKNLIKFKLEDNTKELIYLVIKKEHFPADMDKSLKIGNMMKITLISDNELKLKIQNAKGRQVILINYRPEI